MILYFLQFLYFLQLWVAPGWAAPVAVTICAQYDVDYVDSDVEDAEEDHFHANGIKEAIGVRIDVTDTGGTTTKFAQSAGGAGAGCADFTLSSTSSYSVEIVSEVRADTDHRVSVRDGTSLSRYVHSAQTAWTPVAGTYTVTLPTNRRWNALAAAGRAITRNDADLTSFNLDIFVRDASGNWSRPGTCSGPTSHTCLDGVDLWLSNEDADLKFRITYLLGWVMLHTMGYDRSVIDFTLDDSHCSQDGAAASLGSIEYRRPAYAEGFAYWYASTAFNHSDEGDCSFVYWSEANWDQLSLCHEELEVAAGHVLSCSEGPKLPPYAEIVPEVNYRGYCLQRSPSFASFGSYPRVPLDIVRFFHDRVLNDAGLSRPEVGALMAAVEWVTLEISFMGELKDEAVALGADGTDWTAAIGLHGAGY